MPISIMFHLPFLLPAEALLHIGQWAISRTLDLAHCPICWVHPPTQNKCAQILLFSSISYYYISLYWLIVLILAFSLLTESVNALLIYVYSFLLSDVNSEPNLLIRSFSSYLTPTLLSFCPYFLIFISLPPIY